MFFPVSGLLIFCMFTCNRNVFEGLKQKLCFLCCNSEQTSHYNLRSENDPNSWRWNSNERSLSTIGRAKETYTRNIVGSNPDIESDKGDSSTLGTSKSIQSFPATNHHSPIPSRYGSRSKTMYTLSKTQASDTALNINSFNGRYY